MEGKTINFQQGEYPQLDGLEPGAKVNFTGSAVLNAGQEGALGLTIQSIEFETEGVADRELNQLRGQPPASHQTKGSSENF